MNTTRILRLAHRGLENRIIFQNTTLNNLLRCSPLIRFNHYSRKPLYKRDETKKVRYYIVEKYVEYLKKLETVLEKRFPKAMKVYKQFMEGVKLFIKDTKDFVTIVRLLNISGKKFSDLTRQEMEVYYQLPRDMKRVAPILLITAVPFGTCILPIAYMFPRHLLCSHFWTLQQKSEFQALNLKYRLSQNKPVFRHLQSQLNFLRRHSLHSDWKFIIGILGSGLQPSVEDIIKCKELFMNEPYHLSYISNNHVVHLLRMHEMSPGFFFRRSRLAERAYILKEMDKAIVREGGVDCLAIDSLKKACYIRGLNTINVKNEDMTKYLLQWIELSSEISKDSYSLLLHAPVLLGYNLPSNWTLLYKDK